MYFNLKKKPYFFLIAIVAGVLLTAAAAVGMLRAQPVPPLKKVVLKLKWKHQFQFAGYYAAIERGFYAKAGLEVVLVEPGEDDDPVAAVVDSKAQFGIGTSTLLLDHAAGKPIVAIAPIFQHSPTVLVALSKTVTRPEDLIGKKLMIEPQSADIITYLQSFGVSLSKCILYPHAYSPEPLIKGEVDAITAYLTDEPFLLKSAGVDYHIFSPVESGIDFYGDTLFTSRDYVLKNPETVEAFKRASIEGWIYAFNNPDEIIKLIYEKYGKRHSIEHLKFEAEQMKKYIIPEVIQIGYSKRERWSQIAEVYKKQNLLTANYSMTGFLYEDYAPIKVEYNVWPLLILSVIAVVISYLANFYYRLNLKLSKEVAQRRVSEENLAKSEERYRTLVEDSPIPIAITRLEGREILYVNRSFENTFRVNKNFIIGKHDDIFYENPAVREEVFNLVRNYGYLKNYIAAFKDVEGRGIWISLSGSVIEYEGGRAVCFMFSDISEKIKRESEFSKLSSAKDRFLKITASDLRSSIGTFQSILDYLIKNFGVLKEPEKIDFLYSLKNCADSTYSLLINLLEWTSNAAGDMKPVPVLLPVVPAVNEIFELFDERAAKKQLRLESAVGETVRVFCDENMFKTALRNLVSNAVKFTRPGGTVKVAAAQDGASGRVKLTVSDDGVGIARERIDRLFDIEATFSTEGTDGERGSGIGLVLCNDFIRKNGGEIKIDSDIGRGTCVTVTLPSGPEK